ncbi:MAG: hypothetical protein AMXMBFR82_23090 [Candidatus Hydrogenedentota bacterium]
MGCAAGEARRSFVTTRSGIQNEIADRDSIRPFHVAWASSPEVDKQRTSETLRNARYD